MQQFIVTFLVRIGEAEPTHVAYRVWARTMYIASDKAIDAHEKALEQVHESYVSRLVSCVEQTSTQKATEH